MKETENAGWHRHLWRFVPLILWTCIILYSSGGNASMARTSRFLQPFLELFFTSEDNIHWANVIIRKIAHLTYYSVLAGLASFALLGTQGWFKKNWFWAAFCYALSIAVIDETRQSFDPSRIGSVSDVVLDCIGALLLLSLIYLIKAGKFRSIFPEPV